MIYFDNAATTYPKPDCVYEAINEGMKKYSFNSGRGSYKAAQETFEMIEETRRLIGKVINVIGDKVVFTSSATESMNNIIYGMNLSKNDIVFVSPFEHNAVIRTLHNIGVNIQIIPFDKETWQLNISLLNDMLVLYKPKAIIISHISNVTGFELPYELIFERAKNHNCITILDCAQSFGVYNISKGNCDYVIFAGHKSLYAMFGIAGYIILNDQKLNVYKVGGTGSDSLNAEMPSVGYSRYEAGSLNSVGIYSIRESLKFLNKNDFAATKHKLVSYFLEKISIFNDVIVYLPKGIISNGIVSFNINGYLPSEVGDILANEYDICVRTGFHCAPLVHDFIGSKDQLGTVRISFSGFNTIDEVNTLVASIEELL